MIDGVCERSRVSGDALVLVGEPGIGKTTLLQYASGRWTAEGGRVLTASAVEFEADVPFAGLQQLLNPLLDTVSHRAAVLESLFDPDTAVVPDRLAIAETARRLVREVAADRPILLLVDDLQWLDRSSAAVLTMLVRRLTGVPAGFIGTARSEAGGFFERAGLEEYALNPLNESASAQILKDRHPRLNAAVEREVLALAAGNPLALVELPPIVATSPSFDLSAVPLNRRLQTAFSSRIQSLPQLTRRSLLLVALDPAQDLRTLEAAADGELLSALEPAEDLRLIRITDRVVFAHPLMRWAVIDTSSTAERHQAHRRLAGTAADPDRRAWHLANGGLGPDEDAAAALERAAYRRVRRGDPIGAVTALTHASMLSPANQDRARRLSAAAYIGAHLGGGIPTAKEVLQEVRRLGPRTLDMAVATAFVILNEDGDIDTAHRMLTGALADVDDQSHPIFSVRAAMLTLFYVCVFGGRSDLWTAFDALASRLKHPELDLLVLMRYTHADPANAGDAEYHRLDRLFDQIDQVDDPAEIVLTGLAGSWVDRLDRGRAAFRRALDKGRATDDMNVVTQALALLAYDAFFQGRWAECEQHLAEALKLTKNHGLRLYGWAIDQWIALLAAARGDDETTRRITTELGQWAVPRGVKHVSYLSGYTRTLLALSRRDWAQAYREIISMHPPGTIPPHRAVATWGVLDVVEAAVRTDHDAEARAHVAAARAARLDRISPRLHMLVTAAEALVSADDAAGLFDRALATPDAFRWPFEQARIELLAGEHLRRIRTPNAARGHLAQAFATFERLGARGWAQRASQELRASGQPVDAKARPGDLTDRQLVIARMAATGMSNKDISAELAISERTVASHLYQLFPKLGVVSRSGLRDALNRLDAN
ncbi:AAA family ATPase [Actinoplanes sp. TBRC 11911]|nr:AAA family ATPase [Actinoplanes sp. TBRC 11911]